MSSDSQTTLPIQEIYQRFTLPHSLQLHMIRVAAVGKFITEHWNGPSIDPETIIQALLLHDLGNIAKFREPFLADLALNADHWRAVQQDVWRTYGKNAHDATQAMLKELHVIPDVVHLVDITGAHQIEKNGYQSFNSRIADYADMCVSPSGIEGFEKRVTDLMYRYKLEATDVSIQLRRDNQEVIAANCQFNLSSISDRDFSNEIEQLWKAEIPI